MYYYFMRFKPYKRKNGHSVSPETLKKEIRRPRRTGEENFKNSVGERVCKKVDSIICLA
jgi:hypothetical protein